MKAAGWLIDFDYTNPSLDAHVGSGWQNCGNSRTFYGGRDHAGVGSLKATLRGKGLASLDFGNCWDAGEVVAYLNDVRIGSAPAGTPSIKVSFPFSNGDVLALKDEGSSSVLKVNAFHTDIFSTRTPICEADGELRALSTLGMDRCVLTFTPHVALSLLGPLTNPIPPGSSMVIGHAQDHVCSLSSLPIVSTAGASAGVTVVRVDSPLPSLVSLGTDRCQLTFASACDVAPNSYVATERSLVGATRIPLPSTPDTVPVLASDQCALEYTTSLIAALATGAGAHATVNGQLMVVLSAALSRAPIPSGAQLTISGVERTIP